MQNRRIYLNQENISPGMLLTLSGEEGHHVSNVLRLKAGNPLCVFNGYGSEFPALIESVTSNEVEIRITGTENSINKELKEPLDIALPLLKSDKIETVIRMLTELGVSTVHLFNSQRCVSKVSSSMDKKIKRWERIVLDATRVSGRSVIPEIRKLLSFKKLVESLITDYTLILCYEEEGSLMLTDLLKTLPDSKDKRLCLITGPEGGFSTDEVKFARDMGVRICSMGSRILRAETAPVTALSVITAFMGEM